MSPENLNFWRPGEITWKWILQVSRMLVKTVRCFSASSPPAGLPQLVSALTFRLELSGTSHLRPENLLNSELGKHLCWRWWTSQLQRNSISYMALQSPWWLHGEEFTCQCRRCRFNPWFRKIPWRRKWQPTPVSCLGNPMDRGAWGATVHGVTK